MAFLDNSLVFSSAQAVTVTADSTNVIDITGAGVGNAPAMKSGNGGVIGADMGAGEGVAIPQIYLEVSTTFTAGGSATLSVNIEAAPDNGSNAAGTYTIIGEIPAIPVASLVAGQFLLIFPLPNIQPGEALPRFYKLNYAVGTGPFTAGALTAGIAFNLPTSLLSAKNYQNNFVAV
jgi:hypothetical protein